MTPDRGLARGVNFNHRFSGRTTERGICTQLGFESTRFYDEVPSASARRWGLDSVRVMGDLYHMNIEEDDIPAALKAARPFLAHLHLADSNRAQPGAGHIEFKAAFRALAEIDFKGYMAMECGLRGEPGRVLPEVGSFLRRALQGS
jgi:hypothetical protein